MHIFLMENNRTPLCVVRMTRSRTRRALVLLRVWSSRSFFPLLVGTQNGTAALEDSAGLLREWSMLFDTYSPAVTCLGIYPKSCSFIAKNWKQPRCPLVGEWINCEAPRRWSITSPKTVSCQAVRRQEGSLHAFLYVKEANMKGLRILYDSNSMVF